MSSVSDAGPARAAPGDALIVIDDVTMAFGSNVVQRDLNFVVRKGEVFIIMGGSGCGKSTLLRHMLGLIVPAEGRILYETEDFFAASPARREAMVARLGVLYQSGALWSSMTLAENVGLPLEVEPWATPRRIREIAAYKLALVGLAGFEDFYPSEISGGMRKRAGLARALARDPDIVFFDEPSAGLDPITSKLLDDLIIELRDSLGATIIMVTHELPSVFATADRCVFLDPETKTQLAVGSPRDLLGSDNPKIRSFLTRDGTAPPAEAERSGK